MKVIEEDSSPPPPPPEAGGGRHVAKGFCDRDLGLSGFEAWPPFKTGLQESRLLEACTALSGPGDKDPI